MGEKKKVFHLLSDSNVNTVNVTLNDSDGRPFNVSLCGPLLLPQIVQ